MNFFQATCPKEKGRKPWVLKQDPIPQKIFKFN